MNEIIGQENVNPPLVGFDSANKSLNQQTFSHCKEVYSVNSAEKTSWRILPRENYPKPLIFHDGRLAFRPTYSATLSMFVWLPFGFLLSIIRLFVASFLPYKVAIPILAFTGMFAQREPLAGSHLLRFSPLFAELSDDIVPLPSTQKWACFMEQLQVDTKL
ncbi:unnamed protein product [Fraxinus pennsylvanica]|uniref:Uncharacterized protein n=1 Tax=Fraxinus pennsylvanica TaxID=56036 RepID=A0AAD1ZGF3_9LAMI|nr:unnamed protein product [Fraxinus pennsylvanica]